MFNNQRVNFNKLSEFLIVTDLDNFCKKYHLTKKFASKYIKELNLISHVNYLSFLTYSIIALSFYVTGVMQVFSFDFTTQDILTYCLPYTIASFIGFTFYFRHTLTAYSFYIIYTRFLKGKVIKLTVDLDKINKKVTVINSIARFSYKYDPKIVYKHLMFLNTVLKDFKVSQNYLERTIICYFPAALCTILFLPSMIIYSGQYFTHRLLSYYFLNLMFIVTPVIQQNENLKKQVCLSFSC